MLIMTIQINVLDDLTIGAKEDITSYVERYGDARVISIEKRTQSRMKQKTIGGGRYVEQRMSRVRR